jgi:hypothetical protein
MKVVNLTGFTVQQVEFSFVNINFDILVHISEKYRTILLNYI